jgi:hypothetical protein
MNIKVIVTIAWIISLMIAFYIGKTVEWLDHSFKPETCKNVIFSSDQKTNIWIKKQVWGVTGDKNLIFLTDDELRESPDKSKDVIFNKAETIFYKAEKDTLHIYSGYDYKINPNIYEEFYIKIHVLKNPEFADLYKEVHASIKTTDLM